jgi:hypothetical protein
MSRGQLSLAAGDIDSQIATLQGQIDLIDDELAVAATAEGDPAAKQARYRRAMQLKDEANRRLTGLAVERRRLEMAARQGATPVQPQDQRQQTTAPAPNPVADRYAQIFLDRHEWFDPEDNTHEDSLMVKAIDAALFAEGYQPNTREYWHELERRVDARGLGDGDSEVEDREDRPQRRQSAMPPRSRRGGSTDKRSPGTNLKSLPPFARQTLDELGLLETNGLTKEQLEYRSRLMKTWDEGLKNAAQGARS